MQIYDIKDSKGRVFSFEVDNGSVKRQVVVETIRKICEAKILKVPKFFSWLREEVFCEFELSGYLFQVLEPFGDNSRYWIGPKDNTWHPEINIIKSAFVNI